MVQQLKDIEKAHQENTDAIKAADITIAGLRRSLGKNDQPMQSLTSRETNAYARGRQDAQRDLNAGRPMTDRKYEAPKPVARPQYEAPKSANTSRSAARVQSRKSTSGNTPAVPSSTSSNTSGNTPSTTSSYVAPVQQPAQTELYAAGLRDGKKQSETRNSTPTNTTSTQTAPKEAEYVIVDNNGNEIPASTSTTTNAEYVIVPVESSGNTTSTPSQAALPAIAHDHLEKERERLEHVKLRHDRSSFQAAQKLRETPGEGASLKTNQEYEEGQPGLPKQSQKPGATTSVGKGYYIDHASQDPENSVQASTNYQPYYDRAKGELHL